MTDRIRKTKNGIEWVDGAHHRASLFQKARIALSQKKKAIEYLTKYCGLELTSDGLVVHLTSSDITGIERNGTGKTKPIDISPVLEGEMTDAYKALTQLGFTPQKNRYVNHPNKADVSVSFMEQSNIDAFNKVGDLLGFGRGFRRLDKKGLAMMSQYYQAQLERSTR